MGCVSQVGEQALNVGRVASLIAGLAGDGVRHHRRPPVRLVDAGGDERRVGDPGRPSRSRRRRRYREHVARPDGLEPRRGGLVGLLREAARPVADRPAGDLGRGDRGGVGSEPRVARRVLATSRTCAPSRAIDEGRFEREIVPVEVSNPHAGVLFAVDETPRRDTTLEKMATLPPAFKEDGVVTAGNSSAIVDGAAAMLVASEERASALGLEPRARFVSFGIAGVDPYRMLHGNPQACDRALANAGLVLGRHGRDRGQRGVRLGRPPVRAGHRARRPDGGREPERRRDLARPSARRHRREDHRDAAERARPPRGAVRDRDDVHRPGPGDRRGDRAASPGLSPRLAARPRPGERRRPLDAAARYVAERPDVGDADRVPRLARSGPRSSRASCAILYASVWQAIFGVVEVVGEPEHDPAKTRWAWRFPIRPLVRGRGASGAPRGPPLAADGVWLRPGRLGASYRPPTPGRFEWLERIGDVLQRLRAGGDARPARRRAGSSASWSDPRAGERRQRSAGSRAPFLARAECRARLIRTAPVTSGHGPAGPVEGSSRARRTLEP